MESCATVRSNRIYIHTRLYGCTVKHDAQGKKEEEYEIHNLITLIKLNNIVFRAHQN